MSNTDGEDTQPESGFIIKDLRKELASLREQLETEKIISKERLKGWIDVTKELKQKEQENMELLQFIEQYSFMFDEEGQTRKELELLIQKQKKNLST